MTLVELRYLAALAEKKHFGQAAAACFVTQPTLSLGIRRLEATLGITLVERVSNNVSFTAIGEQIVEQARVILREANYLQEIATAGNDPLRGKLRLGAIATVGPYLFPKLIPQLRELAPQMPVIIQEDFTHRFREKLLQGDIDVVVLALPFTAPGIDVLPVYTEPFVLLMPATHPWQDKTSIAVAELAETDLLMLGEGHCLREQILQACPRCHTNGQTAIIGSSLETLRHMVASNLGMTIMPVTAATSAYQQENLVRYCPFKAPVPSRTIALAWRNHFPRHAVISVLQQALQACALSGVQYV